MTNATSLDSYRLLGRSGLRVSPLALGTMTFGSQSQWCADEKSSAKMFDSYVERGGNFIDTANSYTNGAAEELIGTCATGRRDSLVIATKYTFSTDTRDPNACGNHRKNMMRSVEASLRRLRTDFVDLLYLHAWDSTTSVDEVMRGLDDLVRSGKVMYVGVSNTAAWQVSRMQMLADLRGWAPLIALQIEYNLAERTPERELLPMADALGLGGIAWSPLRSGVLAGKYGRRERSTDLPPDSRGSYVHARGMLTPQALDIVDVLHDVARLTEKSASQVALAWALANPQVTALIVGARTAEQLEDNLDSLGWQLPAELRQRLDAVSAIALGFPHDHLAWYAQNGFLFRERRTRSPAG